LTRLGLKKGAAAPATGQTRANGGVVAPPGLNLPPPPGVAQPQQPVIPSAAEDPFAAMNAMAAVGTVQRAPEIVIVNDGKPVENVGRTSNVATFAKIGVPALLTLLLGVFIGQTGEKASSYNSGLGDAKAILGSKDAPSTIIQLKQTLSQIDTALDEARTKNSFRPDAATDRKLAELIKALDVKTDIVFRAKQNAMEPEVSGQIMTFYAGVAEVRAMLDAHLKVSKQDEKVFSLGKGKEKETTLDENTNQPLAGQFKYAIVVSAPDDKDKTADFGAKIVELGGVYCGSATQPTAKCPEGEGPSAVAYRTDSTSTSFIKGDLAQVAPDAVPTKKVLTILGGSVRDQFMKGAEGSASEIHYQRRLRAIAERICKREQDGKCNGASLLELGNRVEQRVDAESKKSTKFSFFL
jgi:hypothetical protein